MAGLAPNAIHERLRKTGQAWAERAAAAEWLEAARKPLLAELTLRHLEGTMRAMAETRALASPAYRDHLAALVAARSDERHARAAYECARAWCELVRTREATCRAELALLCGRARLH